MNMLNERGHFDHGREVTVSLKSVQASEKVKETARRALNASRIKQQNAKRARKIKMRGW